MVFAPVANKLYYIYMPLSPTEEIKARLDVAEVIRQYIALQKAGANFRGLCPFHKEKSPSLFVSPARQVWKCFGCGVGGDIFSFIEQIEGVEFREALNLLAQKAGVVLRVEDKAQRSERERLIMLCEEAASFFQQQLLSEEGKHVLDYFHKRSVNDETIREFRLGYAPSDSRATSNFLRAKGFSDKEILAAGIAAKGQRGDLYDRFSGRIMFPIFDIQGRVIAFGGRADEAAPNQQDRTKQAKYINSPQTLLYDKSATLYGLHKAKLALRQKDSCIVVEGYTDTLACHQAGWGNVVAASGTALTERQLDIVKRYTPNLSICFDMDIAGDTATKRGIDLAQKKGFNINIVTFAGGKDPADILQQDTHVWEEAIKNAQSILEFYFSNTLARYDAAQPEHKKAIANVLVPVIARIQSRIEQSHWVSRLSSTLHTDEQNVWEAINSYIPPAQKESEQVGQAPFSAYVFPEKKDQFAPIKNSLLVLLVLHPELQERFNEDVLPLIGQEQGDYAGELLRTIAQSAKNVSQEELCGISEKKQNNFLNYLLLEHEAYPSTTEGDVNEFSALLRSWRKEVVSQKLQDLHYQIKLLEQSGQDSQELAQESQALIVQLAALS